MEKSILYIANLRLPTEKAYGIQITKMCEAFANQGIKVKLVLPTRRNPIKEDILSYYQAKNNFQVKILSSPDFYWSGVLDRIAVTIKSFISAVRLSLYTLSEQADIIYSRDELPLYLISFFKKNLIFEAHKYSPHRIKYYRRFKKSNLKIVAISEGIRKEFIKFGYSPDKVLVTHDGVDINQFTVNKTQTECRSLLGLPQDKKLVLYTGHLYAWKGADVLLEAARNFQKKEGILFVFVGGTDPDIKDFKNRVKVMALNNVMIVGHVSHSIVPLYLKAVDVLVLPNSGKENISRLYTSPLKMFEYMASGKPIIASDLPSIREVLTSEIAFFFRSDDPHDLIVVIDEVIRDTQEAERRAQRALQQVTQYSWTARSRKIMEYIYE